MQLDISFSEVQRKMRAVFEIIRIITPIYAFIGVVIGQWLAYQTIEPPLQHTLVGGMMIFCMFAFGNSSNDLLDIDVDSVSNAKRPLILGTLTKSEVIILALSFGGFTLLFGVLGGIEAFFIGLFGLLLVTFYNLYLKKVLLIGNMSIAVWGIIPLALVPIVVGIWHWKLWIIILCLSTMILGNEILSGIPDMEGDKLAGRNTFATKIGNQRSFLVGGSMILAAFLFLGTSFLFLQEPIFFFLTFWGILFTSIMIAGIDLYKNRKRFGKSRSQKRIVAIAFMITVIVLSISS
jgi:4-hydroxybenzoate polyprenyltransferase